MSKRGGKRPGAGRPKGSPNKITSEVRSALKEIVEGSLPKMKAWLGQDWAGSDGTHRARLLAALIEYAAPKLNRADPAEADKPRTVDDMTDDELMAIVHLGEESPGSVYARVVQGTMSADVGAKALAVAAERRGAPVKITFPTGSPGEDGQQTQSARVATAADFGMAEPEPPMPPALPAPAAQPEIPAFVPPEPRKRLGPDPLMAQLAQFAAPSGASPEAKEAVSARPVEGEVLKRDDHADMAAAVSRVPTRRMQMMAAFQEYLQKVEEYTRQERERRGDPYFRPTEFDLRVTLGPRPPNPASFFGVG